MDNNTWIDVLPPLPLEHGVPFRTIYSDGGVAARIITDGLTQGEYVYFDGGTRSIRDVYTRVDLKQRLGFAYALQVLMRRTADEDMARALFPDAWNVAQAMWQDYGVVSGMRIIDVDRLRLAQALAQVFA